jgi:hypothetical protein
MLRGSDPLFVATATLLYATPEAGPAAWLGGEHKDNSRPTRPRTPGRHAAKGARLPKVAKRSAPQPCTTEGHRRLWAGR